MSISDICIRRPVFTWVMMAIPIVLGIVAYFRTGRRPLSQSRLPCRFCQCGTAWCASAEEMESSVTKPLEEVINSISGIDELRSITREGQSTVIIRFVLEKDGDVAAQEIRDKIASVLNALPEGVDTPLVNKFDLDANPIITISISGRRDMREITEIAKRQIQEPLQTINGVGNVFMSGGRSRAINVRVDMDKLVAFGLVDRRRTSQLCKHRTSRFPVVLSIQGQREMVLANFGTRRFSGKVQRLGHRQSQRLLDSYSRCRRSDRFYRRAARA